MIMKRRKDRKRKFSGPGRRPARGGIDEVPEPTKAWEPRTTLGKAVKEGRITDIGEIFKQDLSIMEDTIVDALVPELQEDLLLIGQAKGKFGGGQRRIFRQTQKKTREGNKLHFTTCALVGNKNGYIGVGLGRSRETVPSRDKAKREARVNLMRIRRGCGSWQCGCKTPHSIPFAVNGKCSSVEIRLMPAPKGKGLCVEKECAKILTMAGIKDVWSKTKGHTKTKLNLLFALLDALKNLNEMKVLPGDIDKVGLVEGKVPLPEGMDMEKGSIEKESMEVVSVEAASVKPEVSVKSEASVKSGMSVKPEVAQEGTAEGTAEETVIEADSKSSMKSGVSDADVSEAA